MKKIMALLTVLMCFASVSSIAQEVRGIETRRVIYEGGKKYEAGRGYSTEYYGWEFTNLNTCKVSVDIYLYKQGYYNDVYDTDVAAKVIATKAVVLTSGETYVFKPEIYDTQAFRGDVDKYYVEYKAFKLQ